MKPFASAGAVVLVLALPLSSWGAGEAVGITEGRLVTYVATYDDGHSERQFRLRTPDGAETPLAFAEAPSLGTGTEVRVLGALDHGALNVSAIEAISPHVVSLASPPTPATPTVESFAFVLVDLGGGVGTTAAQAQTAMFGTAPGDKSFAQYYSESSFGKYSVTGDVVGPYKYTMTGCNEDALAKAIEPQIPKKYDHYVYYFGTRQTACTWAGIAEEGAAKSPAQRTWLNGSDSCVVLMQEPGHNLGLMHANSIACGATSFSTTPKTSCTITEYGNPYSTMGHGCHTDLGYERWYEGWLTGCNGVRATQSGTFNLVPIETNCPGGVQVLEVPLPATRIVSDPQDSTASVHLDSYYLELRTNAGSFGAGITNPVVLVYASDKAAVGGADITAEWTEILDMNPSTRAIDTLGVGQTFTDPSGSPAITLESVSATGATVTVTIQGGSGAPTCVDGTTLSGPGPIACGAPPGAADAGTTGGGPDASVSVDASGPSRGDAGTRGATDDAAPAMEAGAGGFVRDASDDVSMFGTSSDASAARGHDAGSAGGVAEAGTSTASSSGRGSAGSSFGAGASAPDTHPPASSPAGCACRSAGAAASAGFGEGLSAAAALLLLVGSRRRRSARRGAARV